MGRGEGRALTLAPARLRLRPARRRGRAGQIIFDRRTTFWALSPPPLAWLGLFLIAPVVLMAAVSFKPDMNGDLLAGWQPTIRHYASLAATGSYWRLLQTSALLIALLATACAYPIAYFIAFRARARAGLYLVLLRVMALKLMHGSNGVINSLLAYLGLIDQPLTILLYNRYAVIITLVYVWVPFAALPILAALPRLDLSLFEAAADLGATPARRFLRITLPLSLPGVLASFFMVFIPTVGEYVTPGRLGGSQGLMYGNIIQDFFTKAANWPFGSALSMVMLAATLALVAVAARLIDLRKLIE